MRHSNNGTRETMQELLEPLHAFGIQVVRRFVKQQHIGLRQEQTAKGDTTLFTTREMFNFGFPRRQAQSIRCNFHLGFSVGAGCIDDGLKLGLFGSQGIKVCIGLSVGRINFFESLLSIEHFAQPFFHSFTNRVVGIELRLLRQIPDFDTGHRQSFALNIGINACHNLQKG